MLLFKCSCSNVIVNVIGLQLLLSVHRLKSFKTEDNQAMVHDYLLHLSNVTMGLDMHKDASTLAEEVAGTMLSFVSTGNYECYIYTRTTSSFTTSSFSSTSSTTSISASSSTSSTSTSTAANLITRHHSLIVCAILLP